MGHRRTREVQMHRFHILQRRSGWGVYTAVTWRSPNQDFRFRVFLLLFQLSSSHLMSMISALSPMWGKRIYIELLVLLIPVCVKLPLSVCRQWLEDSLKENDPTAVQLFLVGTKKDLSVCLNSVDVPVSLSVFFSSQMSGAGLSSSSGGRLKPQECCPPSPSSSAVLTLKRMPNDSKRNPSSLRKAIGVFGDHFTNKIAAVHHFHPFRIRPVRNIALTFHNCALTTLDSFWQVEEE